MQANPQVTKVSQEDTDGRSEETAPIGGGVYGTVSRAIGLGGDCPPVPQFNSKLEKDHYRLREEYKSLQDEYRKTERTLKKYAIELQKTQNQLKNWYNNAREAQHETHRLHDQAQGLAHELMDVLKKYDDAKSLSDTRGKELVGALDQVQGLKQDLVNVSKKYEDAKSLLETGKFKVLGAFLDQNVFGLISGLDTLKKAVRTASEFLADNVVFRSSEAFLEEIEEAKAVVVPFLGVPLTEILSTHGEKASTVGDGSRGSRTLTYTSLFKIASWALPGATNRTAFSKVLEAVLEAEKEVRFSKDKLPGGMGISISHPETGKEYDSLSMEAVDIDGQPIPDGVGTSEEVIGTLAFGLKKGAKTALLPQVLLKSTLEHVLEQQLEEELNSIEISIEQPDCDGRT
ncbi:hypothetical protein CPB83DRAFT_949568 [Crepidotus variabilis]|uniref:Uncharacterized protein n=1 Tax=Crepidotus variabilis TaxID=179855 RepID=A0A9P6E6U0_9AGAR|nr:hypothetical protein CPB83DRAFT_949568 [Crepidotus variabilis]